MKKEHIVLGTVVVIIAILLIAANIPEAAPVDEFVDDYGTDYGAVGVWNFEEGTGTTAFDQSPYGNDGTITGAEWTAGKFGEALTFDGDDYVTIPDSASLDISDYITIEAWGKDPPLEREPSTIANVGEEIVWPAFWQKFKQYAMWDLEWYDSSSWVSVKEDLDVQLSYPEPNWRKVNLVFDASHSGNYRLTFAINKVVRDYVTKIDKYQYELEYDDVNIVFDWSDCKDIPGLQFTHGIKDDLFWFRIRRDNVPLGAHVEIDPATVATSTVYQAVRYEYMRKNFYAVGRFWAFYCDGSSARYETSADGITWTGASTSIGHSFYGYYFDIIFDGTFIHYVRADWGSTYDLYYRRGIPNADGTITWSAAQQIIHNGTNVDSYRYPTITVDTNGCVWIGAWRDDPAPTDRPVVLKNANLDGTWLTDFEYELSAVDDTGWRVTVVSLTDGKVYVIYCRSNQLPLGKLYDAGWGAEENDLADYNIQYGNSYSTVMIGDNIHFVYNRDVTYQIRHNERVWGVGWDAADVLVQDGGSWHTGPALSADPSTGDLYCFWTHLDTDHVYYKQYTGGAWGDLVDWIDESTDEIYYDYLISSSYMDYGGYIGLLYVTKTASPYNVRFAFLTIEVPPPPPGVHKVIVEKIDAYSLYINYTSYVFAKIDTTEVRYDVPVVTDWHYYSMTYDGTTLKLYVDGVLVNSTALAGAIPLNDNNVTIGTRFLGEIDQVRIYKVAKTVGEIRNHYLNSKGMYSSSVIVSDDFRILNTTLDEQLGLDEDGNLTVGGTVDGRDIGGSHYEIISYDVQNLGKNPVNPPVIVVIDNCALWRFTVDTDKVHSNFPIPGDYWGLDIDFYVVWTNDGGVDDNTKNVTWQMSYQTATDGEQVSDSHANSPKNITDSYNSTSGWIEHSTGKMTIAAADIVSKKCMIVQIMAITPPGDALTCEPHMLGVCIGYYAYNVDDVSSE